MIKLGVLRKGDNPGLSGQPNPMTGDPSCSRALRVKATGWTDTRKKPCIKECRQRLEAEKGKMILSRSLQKEGNSTDTLILDFQPPEFQENQFLLCEATKFIVTSYGSNRKLIQSY